MGTDPLAHSAATTGPDRRAFLRNVAVGGAVAVIGSQLLPGSPAAFGQATQPHPDDDTNAGIAAAILGFAVGIRSATGDLDGLGLKKVGPNQPEIALSVLRKIVAQLNDQATTFSALLENPVTIEQADGPIISSVRNALDEAADPAAALGALANAAERLASAILNTIAKTVSPADALLAGQTAAVITQHATILSSLSKPGDGVAAALSAPTPEPSPFTLNAPAAEESE